MHLDVINAQGKTQSDGLDVSDAAFGAQYNEALVHQVVTAYQAGARAGTKAQKTRAQVSGSGVKPWRQKGTGRARVGSRRNPIWRGGGRAFAAAPQDHSQKVNRKMYRAAMCSIMSELVRQERLVVMDSMAMDQPKTKALKTILDQIGVDDALFVTEAEDQNMILSARNLKNIDVLPINEVNPLSLIAYEKVIMTSAAAKLVEAQLKTET